MSKAPTLTWMRQGSPDVSGDFAKNWKNEKHRSRRRFYHTIMSAVYFFAREAIQNMKDAWSNTEFRKATKAHSETFKVRARFVTYHKEEAKKILRALGIDEELDKMLHAQVLPADASDAKAWNDYRNLIKEIRKKNCLRVLYMEEEDASGMFVNPVTGRDGLLAALYSHNQGNPQAHAGGSFGHGKGALAKASNLRTNVAYTNTDWCKPPHNENRMMGVTYMPSFQTGSATSQKRYSGFGLLVQKTDTSADVSGDIPIPFSGKSADAKAIELGMHVRTPGQHGTTMMIVEPAFTADELSKATALYWLPAILRGRLEVTVIEEHRGHPSRQQPVMNTVDPCAEPALNGFCAAQKLLGQGSLTAQDCEQLGVIDSEVYSVDGIGRIAIVATKHDDTVQVDDGHTLAPQIAYSRSRGIGLVIAYDHKDAALPRGLDVRAHFQADPALEELLRSSEPKAHDEWSKEEIPPVDGKKIKAINDLIKDAIRQFVQRLRGNQSQEAKALEVASQAWNKIGKEIGKNAKTSTKQNAKTRGGSAPGPQIMLESESQDNNGSPALNLKVTTKGAIDIGGMLHVLDDSGRAVTSFCTLPVTVPAASHNASVCLIAQDDPENPGSLRVAVAGKHHMKWEVVHEAHKQAEGLA